MSAAQPAVSKASIADDPNSITAAAGRLYWTQQNLHPDAPTEVNFCCAPFKTCIEIQKKAGKARRGRTRQTWGHDTQSGDVLRQQGWRTTTGIASYLQKMRVLKERKKETCLRSTTPPALAAVSTASIPNLTHSITAARWAASKKGRVLIMYENQNQDTIYTTYEPSNTFRCCSCACRLARR